MDSEKSIPMALSGEEIQEAVLFKLSECMQKNCHLHSGNAYSKARIEVSVKMTLYDYGREVRNNEQATVELDSGLPQESAPVTVEGTVVMEPMPPNQVRIETGQDVPVQTIIDGKPTVKRVKYAPRKAKP